MRFHRRAAGNPGTLAVFPGSFNPITNAHLALARSALTRSGEVLFVLPDRLPHKPYEAATFEERLSLLLKAVSSEPAMSVASTSQGLFFHIAQACRQSYLPTPELLFVCGRDAAERILSWQDPNLPPIEEQLTHFKLLVANRRGQYHPPEWAAGAIELLELEDDYDEVSATRVREAIAAGLPWEHWIPQTIREDVARIYRVLPATCVAAEREN